MYIHVAQCRSSRLLFGHLQAHLLTTLASILATGTDTVKLNVARCPDNTLQKKSYRTLRGRRGGTYRPRGTCPSHMVEIAPELEH